MNNNPNYDDMDEDEVLDERINRFIHNQAEFSIVEEVEMYNVYKRDSKIKACMCVNNGRFTFQNFRRTTEPFKERRSGKRQQRNNDFV